MWSSQPPQSTPRIIYRQNKTNIFKKAGLTSEPTELLYSTVMFAKPLHILISLTLVISTFTAVAAVPGSLEARQGYDGGPVRNRFVGVY